jgi:hypothetical protein
MASFHRPGWVYEEKVDGWRMVAYKAGHDVRLMSRQGLDHTTRFAALAQAIAALPRTHLLLAGEVAVYDERLVSRFDLLSDPEPDVVSTPPVSVAFDLLYVDGQDLRARPFTKRREALEPVLENTERVYPVRPLAANGHDPGPRSGAEGSRASSGKIPPRRICVEALRGSGSSPRFGTRGNSSSGGVVERSEGWSLLVGSPTGRNLVYRHFGVGKKLAEPSPRTAWCAPTSPFSERLTLRGGHVAGATPDRGGELRGNPGRR